MMIRRLVGSLIAYVLVIAIIFFILITPKTCEIYKTHGNVNIEKISEGVIVYNDINYYNIERNIFKTSNYVYPSDDESRIVVGWHYNLPFSAVRIYYSYTSDNPDYIIGYNEVYMKEGYDYKSDIFVIENTDIGIVFSDAFNGKKEKIDKFNKYIKVSFNWHSQRHTELMTKLDIILFDDVYYVNIQNDNFENLVYEISDEFFDLLVENGFISD